MPAFEVHSADMMDDGFAERFGAARWQNGRVLQFTRATGHRARSDELTVRNATDRGIRYLVVKSIDLTLVLDLKPGETIRLPIAAHREVNTLWLAAFGGFIDGSALEFRGADFVPAKREREGDGAYSFLINVESDVPSLSVTHPDGTAAGVVAVARRP